MSRAPTYVHWEGPIPVYASPMVLSHHLTPLGPPLPGLPLKRARVFEAPTNATPRQLFSHHASEHKVLRCHETAHRFVRRNDDREMLVYVDGSCLDQNHSTDVQVRRAACAWVFKPAPYAEFQRSRTIRLEGRGPTGQEHPQSSNRAELRGALGALQYRKWYGEGWRRMVVASDSEYLVLGITERIEKWTSNGWRTGAGQTVKNKDLWEALLEEMNDFAEHGLEVLFWRIPREQNAEADQAAKWAAEMKPSYPFFEIAHGTFV